MTQDSLFLTQEELKEFTGASHRSNIIACLDTHKIKYHANRVGNIIVLRAAVVNFLSPTPGGKKAPAPQKPPELTF